MSRKYKHMVELDSEGGLTAEDLESIFDDNGNKSALEELGGIGAIANAIKTDLQKGIEKNESGLIWRREKFGTNELPERQYKTLIELFIEALKDTTLIILCVAAVISLVLGLAFPDEAHGESRSTGWIEGASILMAVVVVSSVNAINNYQKDKQFRVLEREKDNASAFVYREGETIQTKIFDIVVGDIVILQRGDKIPADGIMISGKEVQADQSNLTGESKSIYKDVKSDPFLLSGCTMSDGDAKMIVLAVGIHSQWGKIQKDLESEDEQTPLQVDLELMATRIGYIGMATAVALFIFLTFWWVGERWFWGDIKFKAGDLIEFVKFFIIAVTIVVVAVPEGLPLAVTISLAYSMKKMMNDNNLVRHLSACETMGGVTNICTDKTGTLTENRMTVIRSWISGDNKLPIDNRIISDIISQSISVNSKAIINEKINNQWEYLGNKTECALLVLTKKLGSNYLRIRDNYPIIKQINFSSERKRMSTVIEITIENDKKIRRLHCKGAPEIMIDLCKSWINDSGVISDLNENVKGSIRDAISQFSKDGLRTIAICYRDLDNEISGDISEMNGDILENNLIFIGLFGIEDPLRKGVADSVRQCKRAGITVRMVTGDNIDTAKKIAKECGIMSNDDIDHIAMEGKEFRSLKDNEFPEVLRRLRVLARSMPGDKKLLVEKLKQLNEVVAVTGDGTNDAPALSEAHIGLSMGIEGTGVAKQASDIIILDDNFSSIVKSVMWGRNVRENIQKFLQFQLTVNLVALVIAVVAAVSGRGIPLKAIQLLWVNLIMDTLAALALGTEAPTIELLNRQPVGKDHPLISATMWKNIIGQGVYQLIVLFVLLYSGDSIYGVIDGSVKHYTILFNAFVFCQVFNEINARRVNPGEMNVFSGLFTNWMFGGVLLFITISQIIIVEAGGDAMKTTGLSFGQWLSCILIGAGCLLWGFIVRLLPAPAILCCRVKSRLLDMQIV